MNATDNIDTARKAVDATKEKFSKINEWAEEATRLAREGKQLNTVQEALQGVEAFGKASTVLGFAGAGLNLALLFMDQEPSAEQVILEELRALSTKIDRLWTHVDQQFIDLAAHLDRNQAKSDLHEDWQFAKNRRADMKAYRDAVATGDPARIADKADKVLEIPPGACLDAARNIRTSCRGGLATTNYLEAIYVQSHGDLRQVLALGMAMIQAVQHLALSESLIKGLRSCKAQMEGRDVPFSTPEMEQADYQPIISEIRFGVDRYADRCMGEIRSNAMAVLSREFETLEVSVPHADSAEKLGKRLEEHFFWLDWMVVVYHAVEGWDHHGIQSKGHQEMSFLRQQCKDGAVNVVVAWDETWDGDGIDFHVDQSVLPDMFALLTGVSASPSAKKLLDLWHRGITPDDMVVDDDVAMDSLLYWPYYMMSPSNYPPATDWWTLPEAYTLVLIRTGVAVGIWTSRSDRLAQYGPNTVYDPEYADGGKILEGTHNLTTIRRGDNHEESALDYRYVLPQSTTLRGRRENFCPWWNIILFNSSPSDQNIPNVWLRPIPIPTS